MPQPSPDSVVSTASLRGHPIHPMLVTLPVGFLTAVLLSDTGYLLSQNVFWAEASRWLLLGGIITASMAAVPGFIDFFTIRYVRNHTVARVHMVGAVAALTLSLVNLFNRPDAPEGVPPGGLLISLLVVFLLAGTGWLGGEMVYWYRVGVLPRSHEQAKVASQGDSTL